MGIDKLVQVAIVNNSTSALSSKEWWLDSGDVVRSNGLRDTIQPRGFGWGEVRGGSGISGTLTYKVGGLQFAVAFSNPIIGSHKVNAAWTGDPHGLWSALPSCPYSIDGSPHGCKPEFSGTNGPFRLHVECEAVKDDAQIMKILVRVSNA